MPTFMNFLLRLFLLAAGLLLAASVAVTAAAMLAFWCLRSAWAKLTRRPVMPFVVRMQPRGGFERMYRAAAPAHRSRRADKAAQSAADVTDVQVKS